MTISLCMIVKNETKTLPRALGNLDGFWDELIVVDTGSEDDTVGIAESFGATVLHYPWEYPGDLGSSRNLGLDAATGKWIFVLDADEVIRSPADLREWILNLPGDCNGALLPKENYTPDGRVTLRWNQHVVWLNGHYRYKHRDHEYPQLVEGKEELLAVGNIVIEHRPVPNHAEDKRQVQMDRLKLTVEENPNDAHALYFLHRQYVHTQEYEKALEYGHKYLQNAGRLRCYCFGNMSYCHFQLGNIAQALEWLHRALSEEPQRRYWWIRIAEIHMTQGAWNSAMAYLRGGGEVWQMHDDEREPIYEQETWADLISRCQTELVRKHG